MKTDVIIIGGGPTGLAAAYYLAKEDFEINLLEENKEIGKPLQCGEGVTRKLFNEAVCKGLKRTITNNVSKAKLYFPKNTSTTVDFDACIIDRPKFDKMLAEKAIREGAEISLQEQATGILRTTNGIKVRVKNKRTKEEHFIEGKILVGCDGFRSFTAKQTGLHDSSNYSCVKAVEYQLEGSIEQQKQLEFYFDFKKAPRGYFWIFPKNNDLLNVGVVASSHNIRKQLDLFLEEKGLAGSSKKKIIGGLIPANGPLTKTYADNVIIAGDAAGLTNPMFYGGIRIGIRSSRLVCKIVTKALELGDYSEELLAGYQEKWKQASFYDHKLTGWAETFYNMKNVTLQTFGTIMNEINCSNFTTQKKLQIVQRILLRPGFWRHIPKLTRILDGWRITLKHGF